LKDFGVDGNTLKQILKNQDGERGLYS